MSSVASDKIVPFGQDFVLDDMSVTLTFKEWVAFCLCLIDSSVDGCEYSESRLSSRSGCQFACLLNGIEHSPAPDSGDLREEPVLNGIPLRAVRWVMGNTDIDAKSLCQLYQTPFELPAPGVVRSTSIAENEDGLRTRIDMPKVLFPLLSETLAGKLGRIMAYSKGHVTSVPRDIIYAVRHHLTIGECGIVMVIYFYGGCCVGFTVVMSVRTKEFLLLRVNTEYRNAVLVAISSLLFNDFELLVSQFAVCHRQGLQRLASGEILSLDDLSDGIETYLYMILLREYLLYLGGSQPEPLRICILGKPCNVKFYYLTENGDVLGMLGERTLPATSLPADSSLIEVLAPVKFMETPVDGVAGHVEDAANKAHAMSAVPFCYDGSELSCLPFVRVSEVLHFFVCYYICWIIRDLHNCLEFSYKGTNFSADLRI